MAHRSGWNLSAPGFFEEDGGIEGFPRLANLEDIRNLLSASRRWNDRRNSTIDIRDPESACLSLVEQVYIPLLLIG